MIRIRYKDLSSGLHANAYDSARHGRGGVTVYLQPGLTGSQRQAALRRLRQAASRGYGPALPAPELKLALGADRIRTAFGGVTAVIRVHPAASLLPAMITSVLMALFVLVSVQAIQLPQPGFAPGLASAPRAGGQALSGGPPVPVSAARVKPGSGGQPARAQVTSSRDWPVRAGSGAASGGAAVSGTVSAAVLGTGVAATSGVNSGGDTGSQANGGGS